MSGQEVAQTVNFTKLTVWILLQSLYAVCYVGRCLIQEKQLVIQSEMYAKS